MKYPVLLNSTGGKGVGGGVSMVSCNQTNFEKYTIYLGIHIWALINFEVPK